MKRAQSHAPTPRLDDDRQPGEITANSVAVQEPEADVFDPRDQMMEPSDQLNRPSEELMRSPSEVTPCHPGSGSTP
jgi:hypothetical protein